TGAPSLAALPVRPGGRGTVHHPLVLFAQTASDHGRVRPVRGLLRRIPLHCRIRACAGCPAGLSGLGLADHGADSLPADDPRWHRPDRLRLQAPARTRNHLLKQYLDLMRHVREHGTFKEDRTGTGTYSVFGYQMRFDLADGFPIVTTKKCHLRSIIHELLWFLQGDTNIKYLKDN